MSKGKRKYRIFGMVIDHQTRKELAGLRIEAWDKDPLFDDLLGTAISTDQGLFQIEFDETYFQELVFDQYPDIFFRVFCGDVLVKTTEDAILWNTQETTIKITLEVDFSEQEAKSLLSCHIGNPFPFFDASYYKVGGSLEYQHPTYIVRQADQELYQGLQNGDFCYVLNSRQMGKSSLRVQMMKRLQQEGVKCASIDMMRIGSDVTSSEWYGGVISELIRGFSLTKKINFSAWWRERELLSPIQRLSDFIEDVLLVEFSQKIVIFIDEIDSILKFTFRNDFFSLVRTCYNKRAEQPAYKRLTFAFLGVATPSDLIADRNRTPFNIGRAIALDGFRLEEAQPLAQGLEGKAQNSQAVLKEVLGWTGGQPFLTQKLCSLIAATNTLIPKGKEAKAVERLVKTRILNHWETQDEPEHLRTIRDRLLGDPDQLKLLRLYRQILLKGHLLSDSSAEQMSLRLSGVVVRRAENLYVYNRIYQSLFNLNWVEHEIEKFLRDQEIQNQFVRDQFSQLVRKQAAKNQLVQTEPHPPFEPVSSIPNYKKLYSDRYRYFLRSVLLFLMAAICVAVLQLLPDPQPLIEPAPATYFSLGEQVLIQEGDIARKQEIAEEIAQQNYAAAVADLTKLLQKTPNDPEALIALNNAKVGENPRQQQPYHYTIAVSLPISNRSIGQAKEILRGVAQAQNEVNQQGGIDGVPLKILLARDDNQAEVAAQVATVLAKRPDVLGVIGHYSSDMSETAGAIYQQNQVVMVSPTSTAVSLSTLGDYIFRTVPNDKASAVALANYLVAKLQKTRAAIYYASDSVYSASLTKEFVSAFKQQQGQVVAQFDLNKPDFDALKTLEQANRKDAEALVLLTTTATRPQVLEVIQRNARSLPLIGGDSLYDSTTLSDAGIQATGMVVAVPWVFQPESEFAQTARQLWQADVSWRTVTAYDAAKALIAGLEGRSRQGVQEVLSHPSFVAPGAIEPIRFTEQGDRAQTMKLAIVQPASNTPFGYRFGPAP
jgi:ABC-type branched-subunit amino acid transport system substrate-binding protein